MQESTKSSFSVSVIIPTRNGARWLDDLLTMLEKQSRRPDEVLIIDSSSDDATGLIAKQHGVRILDIPVASFDHGGTRTLGAKSADADILVYMTQDAIPADCNALERLVAAFADDDRIAAVYGRQLPASDATFFSEHLRLFNYPPFSSVRCWQDRHAYGFRTIFISNSFAAYRKEVLEEQGYFPDKLLFGEDTSTVAKLLEKGYCVAYAADACVFHSHNYTVAQDFRRYFDIGVFHVVYSEMLNKFGSPGGAGRKFVLAELGLLFKRKKYLLIPESLLRNAVKFVAYNLGRRYTLLPRKVTVCCSMNRNWWS